MKLDDLKKLAGEAGFKPEMKATFFDAMNAGYAAKKKPKKSTIIELPGSKLIPPYVRGPWKVTDVYFVTPLGSQSGGTTVISYEGVPVWMMQYFGEYQKVAIPCLKAALRHAYARREFNGGRGTDFFDYGEDIYYRNFVQGTFDNFSGHECITDNDGNEIGQHRYHGGIMV